jgi:transposase
MKRFVTGQAREQATLFPERLDDFIAEDNPVRFIDAFVEELDLGELGFKRVQPLATGRPAYHPAVLLKLYIYGYLNRIPSSRRLERECQRNLELMWLTERLAPDHKTVADFRKDNGKAIQRVCVAFRRLCQRLDLFAEAIVAIDGSKFKAVNNRDRNFTQAKLKRRLEQIEESIARYLGQLDSADRQESPGAEIKRGHLKEKLAKLKTEIERLKGIEGELQEAADRQISETDPDARSMATRGRGSGMVGYNVQMAVEPKHHLIVSHEVTNVGHDREHLATMAEGAREAMGTEQLTVVADRGYYTGEEILACEEAGITTYLPRPQTSGNQAKGLFGKRDFRYLPAEDAYQCPAGERLIWRMSTQEKGLILHRYWSSACQGCRLKARCTSGKQRRVTRWEHEAVLDAVQERLDREPDKMRLRRQTVEHPFGTIKTWMGYTHFLTRTLPRVRTEMSLQVLAYNIKRVINILGVSALLEAVRA